MSEVPDWVKDLKNGADIGGRATDVSQIGNSIEAKLKEEFPPNQVPEVLTNALGVLNMSLDRVEEELDYFVAVAEDYFFGKERPRCHYCQSLLEGEEKKCSSCGGTLYCPKCGKMSIKKFEQTQNCVCLSCGHVCK